jgi:hypothetical protein
MPDKSIPSDDPQLRFVHHEPLYIQNTFFAKLLNQYNNGACKAFPTPSWFLQNPVQNRELTIAIPLPSISVERMLPEAALIVIPPEVMTPEQMPVQTILHGGAIGELSARTMYVDLILYVNY